MQYITNSKHALVQHWLQLKKDPAYRYSTSRVLLEGRNCILDACRMQKVKRLLISPEEELPEDILADDVLYVSRAIIKKLSSVKTPDTIIAEVAIPQMMPFINKKLIVAVDGVQDPGNLGTLIRTALALGWEGLFLIGNCCDPYNDKALRAAQGATFMLPLQKGSWDDLQELATTCHATPVVADLHGEPVHAFPSTEGGRKGIVLILGNESQGVRPPPNFAHKKVTIPMKGTMESLNVAIAGAILMYAMGQNGT